MEYDEAQKNFWLNNNFEYLMRIIYLNLLIENQNLNEKNFFDSGDLINADKLQNHQIEENRYCNFEVNLLNLKFGLH